MVEPHYYYHPPPPSSCHAAETVSQKLSGALRRGTKIIADLLLRHNAAAVVGCSSADVRMSLVSPRDVEFSCTSSPPRRAPRRHVAKPRRGVAFVNEDYHRRLRRHLRRQQYWNAGVVVEAAPVSPDVDKAAEDFIQSFYRELMMQKWSLDRERHN